MPIAPINVGVSAGDGTGDPHRTAFEKTNAALAFLAGGVANLELSRESAASDANKLLIADSNVTFTLNEELGDGELLTLLSVDGAVITIDVDAGVTLDGETDDLVLNASSPVATLVYEGDGAWRSIASAPESVEICVALSDETSDLETGTGVVTVHVPFAFTLTEVFAAVSTPPTGAAVVVDINESGTTVLSTKLSVDATEATSATAAAAAVISDAAIAAFAPITFDIDQVGSGTAGAGLKVWLRGYR